MIAEQVLRNESRIVWLEDPSRFDYVRESLYMVTNRRTGRPGFPPRDVGRLIGYAELQREPGPGVKVYMRRVFWLKPYDRGEAEDDGTYATTAPAEAVDPRTVVPGIAGLPAGGRRAQDRPDLRGSSRLADWPCVSSCPAPSPPFAVWQLGDHLWAVYECPSCRRRWSCWWSSRLT
jgi:hypothetical protein